MAVRVWYVGGPLDGSATEFPAFPPSHCHVEGEHADGLHYILFLAELGDDTPVLAYVADGIGLDSALRTLAQRHASTSATLAAGAPPVRKGPDPSPSACWDAEPQPA